MPRYTLYVAQDKLHPSRLDVGSVLCLQMLDSLAEGEVDVRRVEELGSKPTWLSGTPTLLAAGSGEVWRGHQAVMHLHRQALERAAAPGAVTPTPGHRQAATASTTPPSSTPPAHHDSPAPVADGDPDDGMWSSVVPESAEEPESLSKKLTSDDFARATQALTMQRQQQQAPPASSGSAGDRRPPPGLSD